jgi:HK97 family phage prohead protease
MPRTIETRTLSAQVELRATESGTLEGYAAVYGTEADLGYYRETIMPGAFSRAISEMQDVRALMNHDPNFVLGRTASGTLALEEDATGLRVTITPPDTQWARDLRVSIARGDISQMSFGFIAVREDWDHQSPIMPLRQLRDLDLFDVSVVTYPAYADTSISARAARLPREAIPAPQAPAGQSTSHLRRRLDLKAKSI